MFNSKKKKAIRALKIQKAKINDPDYFKDWTWVSQTNDIVQKYIGNNTSLYNTFKGFNFGINPPLGGFTTEQMQQAFLAKERVAIRYIDNCIEYIELNGVYKEPSVKPIAIIKANWLVALYFALLPAIFKLGMWYDNNYECKPQLEMLQQKIQLLEKDIH